MLKNTLATGGYAAVDLFKLMSDVDPEREHYGDWIARRAPLDDPDCVGLLLGAFLNAGARNAAQTLIGRNPAANADLSDDPDIGILLDELSRTDADEQIEILLSRADAREAGQPAEPGSNSELDLNELDDEEEVDRTDPADVAFWLQIRIDEGIPDPVTGLIGPDLPPYLLLGYPESVLELLRTLERAGARRHVRTLAKRTAAIADLLANPELSGRVLSILLDAGASEQVTQLMRHGPAGLAELADPRGIACLLDSLRKAGADEQVAALLARDPAKHAVLGHGGGASLVMALYRAGADAQAESLIALLPDAGEFTEFCESQYGDGPDHAHQYGRKLDGSPESPWGWADLS